MTLKNNRAPLLCCFKLCASFCCHWWIQTGVTVRKCPIWVKNDVFLTVWPWNLTDGLEKQYGSSPKQHQAFCIISPSYVNSVWIYSPETAKLVFDLRDLDPWPLTLIFCMDITFVIGTLWKRCNRRTDRHRDGRTDRLKCSLRCLVAAKNSKPTNSLGLQSNIVYLISLTKL